MQKKRIPALLAVLLATLSSSAFADEAKHGQRTPSDVPEPRAAAAKVPEGYKIEVLLKGLTYPTSAEFDKAGNLYVAEAGYSYGDDSATPRILKVSSEGKISVAAQGAPLAEPINDLLWHKGQLYISHRGKISVLEGERIRDLVTGLPSEGDHHNNQLTAGPDGKLYFGQGVATNSGVVGKDNYEMGWLKKHPDFHDTPARDVVLASGPIESPDVLSEKEGDKAQTSAFHPFGKAAPEGSKVAGQIKAGGTILRMNVDGSGLEVYASGFRNPYGVMWGPDGKLYATENGFDVRGSRPIANDKEDLYVVKQGAWYGWPDFASGIPVTDPQFKPDDGPAPQFLLKDHPPVEKPLRTFPKHSSITKLDFSPGGKFGFEGQMFVAFFGHMAPMTGKVEEHGGHRVVRVDATGEVKDFFGKKEHGHGGGHGDADSKGGSSKEKKSDSGEKAQGGGGKKESVSSGPRRLVDVRFSPKGDALYVVDFGAMTVDQKPHPVPRTGVIWRITREGDAVTAPPANLSVPATAAK